MPETFRQEGFVAFFYANEGREPVHIHVRKGAGFAKFWVEPVALDFARRMSPGELRRAEELICEQKEAIKLKWHEVHGH